MLGAISVFQLTVFTRTTRTKTKRETCYEKTLIPYKMEDNKTRKGIMGQSAETVNSSDVTTDLS